METNSEIEIKILELQYQLFDKRNRFLESIEKSTDAALLKNIYLFNVSALDSYIIQSKNQSNDVFIIAKKMCTFSYIVILLGIIIGFYLVEIANKKLDLAFITTGSGILIQVFASTVFIFYNRTIQQFDSALSKISESQKLTLLLLSKQMGVSLSNAEIANASSTNGINAASPEAAILEAKKILQANSELGKLLAKEPDDMDPKKTNKFNPNELKDEDIMNALKKLGHE